MWYLPYLTLPAVICNDCLFFSIFFFLRNMTLQEENIDGSDLQVTLNYFSLPVLDLSNETDEQTFHTNYIDKNSEKEPDEGRFLSNFCN